MPALRSIYRMHPQTGQAGLWIDTIHAGLVGLTEATFPAKPASGTAAAKLAAYSTALTTLANAWLATSVPVSQMAGSPLLITPEPHCQVVGTNYVCQVMITTITVTSLAPLKLRIQIDDGASTEYAV